MNKNQLNKLSKQIFQQIGTDEVKMGEIFQILKSDGSPKAVEILKQLEKKVIKNESQNQLYIESAFELDSEIIAKIKTDFERILGKKLETVVLTNTDLIGGLKVRNANYIWENSILSNLEQLKGALTNE